MNFFKIFILVFTLVWLTGCATPGDNRSLAQRTKDMTVTSDVNAKFVADPHINASDIDVTTRTGVVTLTGTVDREIDIKRSTELIKEIRNVSKVVNNLTVKP